MVAQTQTRYDSELLPHWRISNERFLEIIGTGLFKDNDRIELLYGAVSSMTPVGPKHVSTVGNLTNLFIPLMGEYFVQIQGTVNIGPGHVLDPDFAVLKGRPNDYAENLAGPESMLLIVEVSNSSIRRDREVKTGIYAAAGIAEYWIADLNTKTMIVQRQPKGEVYEQVTTHGLDAEIDTVNLGDFKLKVGEVFG